ncbi:MAG: MlaD family protein [Treponema sp.]|nr:MlaD family protein [Treponema sp.]
MKFSIKFADQIVGALVILALIILIFVIFMMGSNHRWFEKDIQFITYLSSASGLSRNMPVHYKGFTIGHVKDFKLAEGDDLKNGEVKVFFTIFNEHAEKVKDGSLVELKTSPIPGLGNSFQFYFGNGPNIIQQNAFIPEAKSRQAGFLDEDWKNAPEDTESIGYIIDQVKDVIEVLNISLKGDVGADDYAIGKIVLDIKELTDNVNSLSRSLSGQLSPVINNVESITGRISDPSGAVMSSLETFLLSLSGLTKTLDASTKDLPGFLPEHLPQISSFIADLNVGITKLNDLLISASYNPILRGGIPQQTDTTPGGASPRNIIEF